MPIASEAPLELLLRFTSTLLMHTHLQDVEFIGTGASAGLQSTPKVKKEPSLPADGSTVTGAGASDPNAANGAADPGEGSGGAEGGEGAINVLQPKKKRPARRRSVSEDLPPPVLPMLTVRLERPLPPPDHHSYLAWNILDSAREEGMVAGWVPLAAGEEAGPSGSGSGSGLNGLDGGYDDVDMENGATEPPSRKVEEDGSVGGGEEGTVGVGLAGLGDDPFGGDDSAEAIAARLEAKYKDYDQPKKSKVSPGRLIAGSGALHLGNVCARRPCMHCEADHSSFPGQGKESDGRIRYQRRVHR